MIICFSTKYFYFLEFERVLEDKIIANTKRLFLSVGILQYFIKRLNVKYLQQNKVIKCFPILLYVCGILHTLLYIVYLTLQATFFFSITTLSLTQSYCIKPRYDYRVTHNMFEQTSFASTICFSHKLTFLTCLECQF